MILGSKAVRLLPRSSAVWIEIVSSLPALIGRVELRRGSRSMPKNGIGESLDIWNHWRPNSQPLLNNKSDSNGTAASRLMMTVGVDRFEGVERCHM